MTSHRVSGSTLRAASLFHDANLDRLDLHGRYRPSGRSRGAQSHLPVPDDLPARCQGQVRRIDRHSAPLSEIRRSASSIRASRAIEANAAMCHNDSLTQFTWSRPQSNCVALRGRRHGRAEHLRDGQLRHGARWLRLRRVRAEPTVPRQHRGRGARCQLSRGRRDQHRRLESVQLAAVRDVVCDRRAQSEGRVHHHSRQRHRQHDQPRRRRRRSADVLYVHQQRPDVVDVVREPEQRRALDYDMALYRCRISGRCAASR